MIRVEAMKSHALADRERVETIATSILGKSPISCGFAENAGYVSANEWVEANETKIRYIPIHSAGFVSANERCIYRTESPVCTEY